MNGRDVLLGLGLGAALAYVADPGNGRRRRALARDRLTKAGRKTRDAADATLRDISNRTKGVAAALRGRLRHGQVDDSRLIERVRARLGRVTSHPRPIDVEVSDGVVMLRGPALAREADRMLKAVKSVPGVRSVADALDRHESSDNVPSLQGDGNVAGARLDLFQSNWAPATKALVTAGLAATGICIAAYAGRR
jgi:hypothetical protein